ncbi:unnamed protein product, partial [Brassica oleracea]
RSDTARVLRFGSLRISDFPQPTSTSGLSTLPCSPYTRNLDWLCHKTFQRLLPSSRIYPSVGEFMN